MASDNHRNIVYRPPLYIVEIPHELILSVFREKSLPDKLLKISIMGVRELEEKEFEHQSLEKLMRIAYQKYMVMNLMQKHVVLITILFKMMFQKVTGSPNGPGGKSASSKLAEQAFFVELTSEQCDESGTTGKSCFTNPLFREMLVSVTDVDCGQLYGNSFRYKLSLSINNHDRKAKPSSNKKQLSYLLPSTVLNCR
ncbi:hypothetical protein L1987_14108 [Smallanthus sonchifolius]|uniref:Uncharacterized protein n=1 Tax=Smallanthus sonchifolius TaxID=185202 RepID=A0ACB9J3E8_9ASTR|nr:hypothetical protein L1987_14108 [Smallanthus sonchifolius]